MSNFNFLVKNEFFQGDESELFFGGENIIEIDQTKDIFDILVIAGIFLSRGQAKKNSKIQSIPDGFTQFKIGKLKHEICILKPTEKNIKIDE